MLLGPRVSVAYQGVLRLHHSARPDRALPQLRGREVEASAQQITRWAHPPSPSPHSLPGPAALVDG